MRSTLFEVTTLVDDAGVVVALKDLDGIAPVNLFLANFDRPATTRTKFGSKNANLGFESKAIGGAGNAYTLTITEAANQVFSVAVVTHAITINLACDRDGLAYEPATKTMDRVNADTGFNTVAVAALAAGSDGSAPMKAMTVVSFAGGLDASELGPVVVEISPWGAPAFAGPWVRVSDAEAIFSFLEANKTAEFQFSSQEPIRGLRITADKDGNSTTVKVTSIAIHKLGL